MTQWSSRLGSYMVTPGELDCIHISGLLLGP